MCVERRGRLTHGQTRVIKHNLTGNKYGKYIFREKLENNIVRFLNDTTQNYQIISGFGGMGKSYLIYSVLNKIIDGAIILERLVDSIIWVTDTYNPGDLNVSKVIDEIKLVYGTQPSTRVNVGSIEDKEDEAKGILASEKLVILVIDNFETIKDDRIKRFIFELPSNCKVIITSKMNTDACVQNGVIEVQNAQCINDFPMSCFDKDEWIRLYELIRQEQVIDAWTRTLDEGVIDFVIDDMYKLLGGVPFPFEMLLVQMAKNKLHDKKAIHAFVTRKIKTSGNYDRMINYSWNILEDDSRAVLVAAALCGYLVDLDLNKVSYISGVHDCENESIICFDSRFESALESCLTYGLIEINSVGNENRYYLPGIVYRFIISKALNDTSNKSQFADLISNWINYYIIKTSEVGLCYSDTHVMRSFDSIDQKGALEFVLDYCYSNQLYKEYVVISNNMRYFFYTRSIWETGDNCIHIKRAKAANIVKDYVSELEAYVYYINIASKYRQLEGISAYLQRSKEIINTPNFIIKYPESYYRYRHAIGLYYYHIGDYDEALKIWEGLIHGEIQTDNQHDIEAVKRWHIKCVVKSLEHSDSVDQTIIESIDGLLKEAQKSNFERAIIDYSILLVELYYKNSDFACARAIIFDKSIGRLVDTTNDSLYRAKYYYWRFILSKGYVNACELNTTVREFRKNVNTETMKNVINDYMNEIGMKIEF